MWWSFVGALWGCHDPLAELEPGGAGPARVTLSAGGALDRAPRVLRFHVEHDPGSVDDLALFEGELSSYYRSRILARELPEALVERRIDMLAWRPNAEATYAQPSEVLVSGTTYSLAALGHGVLAQVVVAGDEAALLARRWPGEVGGAYGGLYCLDPALDLAPFALTLAPDEASASFTPLEFVPHCARLTVTRAAGVRVPPPSLGGVLIDPIPLIELPELTAVAPLPCAAPCTPLGPGCLCVEADRALLTGPRAPAYWLLNLEGQRVEAQSFEGETNAERDFVVPGLRPFTRYTLRGVVFDSAGRGSAVEGQFQTAEAHARLVINEVYANANGPEPDQEWVELTNAGSVSTSLAGYVLEDVGGAAPLPDVELPPNAYAIVVNAGYAPEPDYDSLPATAAVLVQVERLGKSGLSNQGEALRLRAPNGEIASRFPALPAPDPGVSSARRAAWSLDDDPDAFAGHGSPGASPGAANSFDSLGAEE